MELFGLHFDDIAYWHWGILASVLFVLEILTLSFFFLWFAAAAVIVGVVFFFTPSMSWETQFVLWAVISIVGAFGWRAYKAKNPNASTSDEPMLNRRGQSYVGRVFTLEAPIKDGFGKVKVDDSTWKIECAEDLPKGAKVKVTALDGTILKVEKV